MPEDSQLAKKVVAESTVYTVCDNVLYYVGSKQIETARVIVPQQLCQRIMQDYHDGHLVGHFSGYTRAYQDVGGCQECMVM